MGMGAAAVVGKVAATVGLLLVLGVVGMNSLICFCFSFSFSACCCCFFFFESDFVGFAGPTLTLPAFWVRFTADEEEADVESPFRLATVALLVGMSGWEEDGDGEDGVSVTTTTFSLSLLLSLMAAAQRLILALSCN